MNSQSTITKIVSLKPNWKDNLEQGFNDYLLEVYNTNKSISDLFDNPNINVVGMTLTMEITVEQVVGVLNEIPLVPVDLTVAEIIDIVSEESHSDLDIPNYEEVSISSITDEFVSVYDPTLVPGYVYPTE